MIVGGKVMCVNGKIDLRFEDEIVAIILWDVIIMTRLWFWLYNRMQGGDINNRGMLCVLSLIFCLIFL